MYTDRILEYNFYNIIMKNNVVKLSRNLSIQQKCVFSNQISIIKTIKVHHFKSSKFQKTYMRL